MALQKSTEIKRIVYAQPDLKADAIASKLRELGLEVGESTISTVRSDFLNSLTFLKSVSAFNASAPVAPAKKAKKAKRRSRADRWADACSRASDALSDLRRLQEEYEEWKDNLPESLQSSPVGEKLEEVCGLDIEGALDMVSDAEGIDLPLGFGRD